MFFWFCGENKGRQIFDKQKSAGRLIKISYRNLIKSQPCDRKGSIVERAGLSKYRKNLKQRQP